MQKVILLNLSICYFGENPKTKSGKATLKAMGQHTERAGNEADGMTAQSWASPGDR